LFETKAREISAAGGAARIRAASGQIGGAVAGSTTKKAVIRRFEREPLSGFVNPQTYLQSAGVELMTPGGALVMVAYGEVKTVSFVRDFDTADPAHERKVFNTRPKTDGLWLRLTLRDGEVMEGVLSNNLLALEPYGFTVVPPDAYSNHQRIFVPKSALREVQVLGVVGSPLRKRKAKPTAREQIGLFE
jgi:hypothetical protein